MDVLQRQRDLLQIVKQVDISPSMFKNATDKYQNLAQYLEQYGIQAEMYPQGSFALGTVVRPYAKDIEPSYDLDFICQVRGSRDDFSPDELRRMVETALYKNDIYRDRLELYDECLTIRYADIGNYGFSIDIVPSVSENALRKAQLRLKSFAPELIETAIAFPKKQGQVYGWATNNPKGYREWFNRINAPFAEHKRMERRQKIFSENKMVFDSVEDVPPELERSSLQRVIQILKYHRNVYYSKLQDGEHLKPISAIINTVAAQISASAQNSISVFDLLDFVTKELAIYAERQTLTESAFVSRHGSRNVIRRTHDSWVIMNPANPEDNLADGWNSDSRIPARFFVWAAKVRSDLIDSLRLDESDFRTAVESAFGVKAVNRAWPKQHLAPIARTFQDTTNAKPWKAW